MSRYRTLVIGTDSTLVHPRADELFDFLETHGVHPIRASELKKEHEGVWDLIFFIQFEDASTPSLKVWTQAIEARKVSGRVLCLYRNPLADDQRATLDPEIEIGEDHALAESLSYLFDEHEASEEVKGSIGTPLTFDLNKAPAGDVELTAMEVDFENELVAPRHADKKFESIENQETQLFDNDKESSQDTAIESVDELAFSSDPVEIDNSADQIDSGVELDPVFEAHLDSEIQSEEGLAGVASSDLMEQIEKSEHIESSDQTEISQQVEASEHFEESGPVEISEQIQESEQVEVSEKIEALDPFEAVEHSPHADESANNSSDDDWGASLLEGMDSEPVAESNPEEEIPEFSIESQDSKIELSDIKVDGQDSMFEKPDSKIEHPDSNISAPLAGRDTFNADLSINEIFKEDRPQMESTSGLDSSVSYNQKDESGFIESEARLGSSTDLATLQKYAALKEREAREREATIKVLKGQLSKMDVKLSRSEAERRRLTLESSEFKNQNGTLEEDLNQKKFYLQKIESQHQEEMRGLNLRLDNAIFQSNKAQNKLEEFRERVRNDFMKIRTQERELFNKLELQKRDAEALLASKDEQLLNQKREIDRLQYELDNLRERMIEETEQAEDRASRLSRAVQSLRLAHDMLSGLTEEVLPAAGENFNESSRDDDEEVA